MQESWADPAYVIPPQGQCREELPCIVVGVLTASGMKVDLARVICMFLLVSTLAIPGAFSQELKIDRKKRTVPHFKSPNDDALPGWVRVKKDLYIGEYTVPPTFLKTSDDIDGVTEKSAREILESVGIEFGKNGKVEYHSRNSTLTLALSYDQMELVDAYLGGCGLTSSNVKILIHVEIFELPTLQALELIESCMVEGDHTPERNAVLKLVKEGHARLVAMPTILARSGQRSQLISADDVIYPVEVYTDDEGEGNGFITEERQVGTILTVDAVLDLDHETIELNLDLEHHTALPEMKPLTKGVEIPQFHSKKITTVIIIRKGDYLLIGSWKPTGKPEHAEKDLSHVIFVTANVQAVGDYGLKEVVPGK